ncbi:MAG: hypothetical protein FJY85_11800, partial [Deltaproteobacteria bacterium]|nr:hypothetical protein [Deltaproteobacteria bacterium]
MSTQPQFDFTSQRSRQEHAVEETGPVVIRLKKAFSWQSSYHKYPFYLAEADAGRLYSEEEVYLNVFHTGTVPATSGKGQHDWAKAAFGIEVDPEQREVVINGIGLIEKAYEGQYRLTDAAIRLGQAYAADPGGSEWRRTFAEILAQHDVRLRVVLYHLGILGYALHFPNEPTKSGFGAVMTRAELVSRSESLPFLNETPKTSKTSTVRVQLFNQLLDRYRLEALGPFIARKIESHGLSLAAGIEFQGGKMKYGKRTKIYPEPSTNDLGLVMKQSLALFADLGVLAYEPLRHAWAIDYSRAIAVFSSALVADLFVDRRDDLFGEALHRAFSALVDQDGFALVRLLRERTCDELTIPTGQRVTYFNRQIARLLSEGRLSLGKTMGW